MVAAILAALARDSSQPITFEKQVIPDCMMSFGLVSTAAVDNGTIVINVYRDSIDDIKRYLISLSIQVSS